MKASSNTRRRPWYGAGPLAFDQPAVLRPRRSWFQAAASAPRRNRPKTRCPINPGGLNGSTQHFLEVYSPESENLKSLVGVDSSVALLCSDPTGNSRSGLF